MAERRSAKLFQNGGSQAVRLPADFRFDGDEVYAWRDERTGDVLLSSRPGGATWDELFTLLDGVDVSTDFMSERPDNVAPEDRGPFDERCVDPVGASRVSR